MTFQLGTATVARARLQRLFGQPALGFFRLVADIEIETFAITQHEQTTLENLCGVVTVQTVGRERMHVGHLVPQRAPLIIPFVPDHERRTVTLELALDAHRIEAIEAERLGRALEFTLTLAAAVRAGQCAQVSGEVLEYRANQGTWVEILEQMGYRRTLLLEVPMPDAAVRPALADAVGHLEKAHGAMLRGDWRNAVGGCREVVESLGAEFTDPDPDFNHLFANSRAWNKDLRFKAIRRSLKLLSDAAHHTDDTTKAITWDRADAQAAVTMAASLVRWHTRPAP